MKKNILYFFCLALFCSAAQANLNKVLSVSINKEVTLSVSWIPEVVLANINNQAHVGEINLSGVGFSSVNIKSADPADNNRQGMFTFRGPDGGYIIAKYLGYSSSGITVNNVLGGIKLTPSPGQGSMPTTVNVGLNAIIASNQGDALLPAGRYIATVNIDSVAL